ncbi:MAG TPA: CHAD domain-containing protein [Solirubrobacterales bacterium]|nr:CHAD domain-containing protein [Solirubrobacterales bacterium]
MPSEIERKFLLEQLPAELEQSLSAEIEQGYLAAAPDAEVRVRRRGEAFSLTLKRGAGEEREEVEVELDERQFQTLWGTVEESRLTKRRYLVPLGGGLNAEVDVYFGSLAGLRVAEVEFPSREAAASFQPPEWFGREVTGDRGYANRALAIAGIPGGVSGIGRRKYALKEGEPLGEGLRRIAAGRAEKALERLRASASGEAASAAAIHGARKDMKKLRTLLRLLRGGLPKKVYAKEMSRYRDAARKLSESRDAEVKLATVGALVEAADGLPAKATEMWRQILDSDREAATGTVASQEAIAEAVELIEAGCGEIEGWQLAKDPWKAVVSGVTRVYRRGRRAMRAAEADPGDDGFHEWRKRAKDLRYGLELLSGAWSGPLAATAAEAVRLGDLLGGHHDLAVLREDLHQRRLGEEETRDLEAAIEARQEELAAEALRLGRRLYAERPKDFGRRLGRYWRAWRG